MLEEKYQGLEEWFKGFTIGLLGGLVVVFMVVFAFYQMI
jgi:hypothetical protein